ncbi:hypothetical protein LguiB_020365 [Lonicera macranthoides]
MEYLQSKVTTKEAPSGTVGGGADVVLIAGGDLARGRGFGSIRKYGTILDKGMVGKGMAADKDGGARAHFKADDGTILEHKTPEGVFDFTE